MRNMKPKHVRKPKRPANADKAAAALLAIVVYVGFVGVVSQYEPVPADAGAAAPSSIAMPSEASTTTLAAPPVTVAADGTICGVLPLNDAERLIAETWPCDQAVNAVRLARCESASTPVNPNAVSPNTKHGRSYGVFQLNERWQSARFERVTGLPFESNWMHPAPNIATAYNLYLEQGWSPWTCAYSNHLGYLPGRHRV